MTSGRLAASVIAMIRASDVTELVVCGGSRNAPLIAAAADRGDLSLHPFYDERSAAFFALGRARSTGRPVAVITTSGTAAAELLPATVEAHYSGAGLLLVTADRPRRHAGSGAPQAIEQPGLFGVYVEASIDLEATLDAPALQPWSRSAPYHLNVRFDEPLMDQAPTAPVDATPIPRREVSFARPGEVMDALEKLLATAKQPLLLIGPLDQDEMTPVAELARGLGIAVWAEALSGLRGDSSLRDLQLTSGERMLADAGFDAVLRIGGVPTTRFWRDLDERFMDIPVVSVSRLPFFGLPRATHFRFDLASGIEIRRTFGKGTVGEILRRDREIAANLSKLLDRVPRSEPALIREISTAIPDDAFVYLGNSLPIREFDLFAERRAGWRVGGNRGANGIDGQISTFFGMAPPEREAWCIVGDLTALYDLSSLWAARFCRARRFRIVVVNNGGGRIFSRVPSLRRFEDDQRRHLLENEHSIDLEPWPKMWGLPFRSWSGANPDEDRVILEVRPDSAETDVFWREYDSLWTAR